MRQASSVKRQLTPDDLRKVAWSLQATAGLPVRPPQGAGKPAPRFHALWRAQFMVTGLR